MNLRLTSLGLALALFVSPAASRAGVDTWLQGGLLTPELITALKDDLALSPEQESRMQAALENVRAEAASLETAFKEKQREFNQMLRQPDTTQEQAAAALTRLLEAESPLKQLQLRLLLQMRDLLSPEQQRKAVALAPGKLNRQADLEGRVRAKATRLRAAVETLGIPPTTAMKDRGAEVESLIRANKLSEADKALDKLISEGGLDSPAEKDTTPDFATQDPGAVDVDTLRERYTRVHEAADRLVSIPKIRRLLLAREALEEAKAREDAEGVGRILTWAEAQLK